MFVSFNPSLAYLKKSSHTDMFTNASNEHKRNKYRKFTPKSFFIIDYVFGANLHLLFWSSRRGYPLELKNLKLRWNFNGMATNPGNTIDSNTRQPCTVSLLYLNLSVREVKEELDKC